MPNDSTRQRLLALLRQRGPCLVAELSRELGITPTAVRQHLAHLQAEGWVQPVGLVRGTGRPARTYVLTPQSERLFAQQYDRLAMELLEALCRLGNGGTLLRRVLEVRRRLWLEEYSARLSGESWEERMAALLSILEERGSFPELLPLGQGGYLLTEHHCTVGKVAARFPELCEEERKCLADLLQATVERRQCRALGDRACSFLIVPRLEAAAVSGEAATGG
ncbi:MAG: helix-turn-helix transcriptional regulator [Chloroflexia bacterium]